MSNVTPAAQWRKHVEVTFPSGNTAVLRDFSWEALLATQNIPEPLLAYVIEVMDGHDVDFPTNTLENKKALLDFMNRACEICFVQPRFSIAHGGSGDVLGPDDISMEDKQFVFRLLNEGVEQLSSFRLKQEEDVVAVDHEQAVPDTTLEVVSDGAVG